MKEEEDTELSDRKMKERQTYGKQEWCSGLDQLGNTSSRTITEVNQRYAQLVLGWETLVQELSECCC